MTPTSAGWLIATVLAGDEWISWCSSFNTLLAIVPPVAPNSSAACLSEISSSSFSHSSCWHFYIWLTGLFEGSFSMGTIPNNYFFLGLGECLGVWQSSSSIFASYFTSSYLGFFACFILFNANIFYRSLSYTELILFFYLGILKSVFCR